MNIQDSYNLDTPLTFQEWRNHSDGLQTEFKDYNKYIQAWYDFKNKTQREIAESYSLKSEFIQLIKNLSEIFDEDEKKKIFNRVDFNKSEDLLKLIPYCAKKLKEISLKINLNRKSIKTHTSRLRYLGSNGSVEHDLKSFLLKNFTKKNQEDLKPYPVIENIKDNLQVKIEELYEEHPNTDKEFTLNDQNLSLSQLEFSIQNDDSYESFILPKLAKSSVSNLFKKYLSEYKESNLTNQKTLDEYLNLYFRGSENFLGESQYSLNAVKFENEFQDKITFNLEHGNNWFYWPSGGFKEEPRDGIQGNVYEPININESSLVKIASGGGTYQESDLLFVDKNGYLEGAWFKGVYTHYNEEELELIINNNETVEFLFPWVGYTINPKTLEWIDYSLKKIEPKIYNNLAPEVKTKLGKKYFTTITPRCSASEPIFLNKSTLITSGAIAGRMNDTADVIYKSKNIHAEQSSSTLVDDVAFLYKFQYTNIPIEVSSENYLNWPIGRTKEIVLDQNPITYTKEDVLSTQLSHINTSKNMTGAVGGLDATTADRIFKMISPYDSKTAYEGAWLKSPNVTEMKGVFFDKNISKEQRRGKLILQDYYNSYLIYPGIGCIEYDSKTDTYTYLEATYNDVPVAGMVLSEFITEVMGRDKETWRDFCNYYEYINIVEEEPYSDESQVTSCCVGWSGPVQPSLSFKAVAGSNTTFIWSGPDTYADDVFNFKYHKSDCSYYINGGYNYAKNLEYLDLKPLNQRDISPWEKCSCKCVNFSPIGHSGESYKEHKYIADLLYADPYGLQSKFSFEIWTDSRGFTAANSPQFAFFQLNSPEKYDKEVGFGPGKWKTGNGKRLILKTGKTYTYRRSNLHIPEAISSTTQNLYKVVNYPYPTLQKAPTVNTSCFENQDNKNDIVLLIDKSLSMAQSDKFDLIYKSINSLISHILPSTEHSNNLLGLITINNQSTVIRPLTNRSFDIFSGINQIKDEVKSLDFSDISEEYQTSLLKTGLKAAYEMLKNSIQLAPRYLKILNEKTSEQDVLYAFGQMQCSNLQELIDRQMPAANLFESGTSPDQIYQSLPRTDAKKKIILFSDGKNTEDWVTLEGISSVIKNNGVEIYCVDVNEEESFNLQTVCNRSLVDDSVMRSYYFSLRHFLNVTDLQYENFGSVFAPLVIGNTTDIRPRWCKLKKSSSGQWIQTDEPSDMSLDPGDFLLYKHPTEVTYKEIVTTQQSFSANQKTFSIPQTDFAINVRLFGWDYTTNKFNPLEQINSGARPFWAKTYFDIPEATNLSASVLKIDTNYNKQTSILGGQDRLFGSYLTIHQPEISHMLLENEYIYKYIHNGISTIKWSQPTTISTCLTANEWKKLILSEEVSNISTLPSKKYSLLTQVVSATDEASEILLESYSNFKPTYYNYYKRKAGVEEWIQPLQIKNWCKYTYSKIENILEINASEPSRNLLNRFTPSIAAKSDQNNTYSLGEVGGYMTPDNFKISSYRESGSINVVREEYIDETKDSLFPDSQKYINYSLGLTKEAQYIPYTIKPNNFKWFLSTDDSQIKGKLINVRENQTLNGYQSKFEETGKNEMGICLQNNYQYFWVNGEWTKSEKYPLLKTGKLSLETYYKRIEDNENNENMGMCTKWISDLNNVNYVLIK